MEFLENAHNQKSKLITENKISAIGKISYIKKYPPVQNLESQQSSGIGFFVISMDGNIFVWRLDLPSRRRTQTIYRGFCWSVLSSTRKSHQLEHPMSWPCARVVWSEQKYNQVIIIMKIANYETIWQRWDLNPRLRRDWCLKPAP